MTRGLTVTGAALIAALTLSACGGSDTAADSVPGASASLVAPAGGTLVAPASPQPTPTEVDVTDSRAGLPDYIPEVDGEGLDGLAPAISSKELEALPLPEVSGATPEQVRQAVAFAMAFTSARYNMSGLWTASAEQLAGQPVAYYFLTNYLTKDALEDLQDALVSPAGVAKNQELLDTLAPPAPGIDGQWLVPALGNWTVGTPTISSSGKQLTVAFEAAGAAVYKDPLGVYFAMTLRDRVAYVLTVENGNWRVVEWSSEMTTETPKALEVAPVGRHENTAPIDDVIIEIPDEQ